MYPNQQSIGSFSKNVNTTEKNFRRSLDTLTCRRGYAKERILM